MEADHDTFTHIHTNNAIVQPLDRIAEKTEPYVERTIAQTKEKNSFVYRILSSDECPARPPMCSVVFQPHRPSSAVIECQHSHTHRQTITQIHIKKLKNKYELMNTRAKYSIAN